MGSDLYSPAKVYMLPYRIERISRATSYGLSRVMCRGSSGRWQSSNSGCDRSRRGEPGGGPTSWVAGGCCLGPVKGISTPHWP